MIVPDGLVSSGDSPRLVWASNTNLIFESNAKKIDEKHKNLKLFVLVKKNDELALAKAIDSVANYEIKLKEKSQNNFFLIYAKYKESNVKIRIKKKSFKIQFKFQNF